MMETGPLSNNTHSILIGYITWIFGFTGSHRFYYGRQITGTLWFLTFGLFLIGWIIDLFLIPGMDREADAKYTEGPTSYNIAWILLAFLGGLGVHRLYIGKWVTGLLWLLLALTSLITFPPIALVFLLFWLFDLWTLNEQIDDRNRRLLAAYAG